MTLQMKRMQLKRVKKLHSIVYFGGFFFSHFLLNFIMSILPGFEKLKNIQWVCCVSVLFLLLVAC
ncbi:hypothetical protein OIU77_001899 [Salix suchowensis]|uniref:Uncharacterized protein n=1 Tax=Salix suchowensis TaxID=1278906 RepID=A0ABQ9B304_9ROSI|nr:hypothetical protein OIU77_001899 [Salix suchowensis]